ncbi:MAG: hypothetical protein B6D56_07585 [Candidatus Omnitrophica bacterium 4484_70.1]|nr:MAG: hypothetical protein B6D56_07585 [Candidatus Omnitrophica bacterium 4484_70.1]
MRKNLVDISLRLHKEKRKYFENYKIYCKRIKEIAESILGEVKVLVFGSVIKNKHQPTSDIDVLIISENLPQNFDERARIRTEIKSKIAPFSPFQIHLSTPEEFDNWYKNFLKDEYEEV